MKLLINGSAIIGAASQFNITANDVRSPDTIYPLGMIGNYQIVDVPELPGDFTPGGYSWVNSALVRRPDDPVALAAAKQAALDALEAQRVTVQNKGCLYGFPDGQGHIQTRVDTQDLLNINGQVTAALILKSQNQNGAVIPFRDAENVTHMLTPDQMVAAGMAAQAFVSSVYQAKWSKANDINALTSITAINSYNLTTGWPA